MQGVFIEKNVIQENQFSPYLLESFVRTQCRYSVSLNHDVALCEKFKSLRNTRLQTLVHEINRRGVDSTFCWRDFGLA